MELVGEEKRIQALFSELRLEDEQAAPSFVAVWNRAQLKTIRPRRAFSLSFVAATALLVCALVSLALWTRYSQRTEQSRAALATVPPVSNSSPAQVAKNPEPKQFWSRSQRRFSARSRALRLTAQQQALLLATNRKAARDAKAIESWQSPTSALLSSPSGEVLTTLPQLNENANELKSFLPSRPK
jgi:hypothetical protein